MCTTFKKIIKNQTWNNNKKQLNNVLDDFKTCKKIFNATQQWKELVRSINGKAVKRTDTKHTGMYSNTHTIKSIQGNLKNNQMTKDLPMQGSCIAKVVSIHSYPRDLDEQEFQE